MGGRRATDRPHETVQQSVFCGQSPEPRSDPKAGPLGTNGLSPPHPSLPSHTGPLLHEGFVLPPAVSCSRPVWPEQGPGCHQGPVWATVREMRPESCASWGGGTPDPTPGVSDSGAQSTPGHRMSQPPAGGPHEGSPGGPGDSRQRCPNTRRSSALSFHKCDLGITPRSRHAWQQVTT